MNDTLWILIWFANTALSTYIGYQKGIALPCFVMTLIFPFWTIFAIFSVGKKKIPYDSFNTHQSTVTKGFEKI